MSRKSTKPKSRHVGRWLLIIASALAILAAIRWQATLSWIGNTIISSQAPESADLILVLGGDFWGHRVVQAAELGRQGYAPLVLFSGPSYRDRPEGEFAVQFLVERGYPAKGFEVFGHHGASTIEEALALRQELARRGVKRAILVTSSYHSRRALIALRLFCPGIRFISVPAPDDHYAPDGWWRNPSSRDIFFSEWTKMLGTVLIAYPTYLVTRRRMPGLD